MTHIPYTARQALQTAKDLNCPIAVSVYKMGSEKPAEWLVCSPTQDDVWFTIEGEAITYYDAYKYNFSPDTCTRLDELFSDTPEGQTRLNTLLEKIFS
jgi:hypothetical protein